jgi:hypothetical protein
MSSHGSKALLAADVKGSVATPVKCTSEPMTPPSRWQHSKCAEGVELGAWQLNFCEGKGSCQNRAEAWAQEHIYLKPAEEAPHLPKKTSLVVFLPGTGSYPAQSRHLLQAISQAGHYVIGLSYLTQPAATGQVNAWCTLVAQHVASAVEACDVELHEFMLFGDSPGKFSRDLWSVDPGNSVESLLIGALKQAPWGQEFLLAGNHIDWNRIIVSGHSQGASHAAYLSFAKQLPAVLLSGPQDCLNCSAKWVGSMARQNVTRRMLFHQNEECGPNPIDPASCDVNLLQKHSSFMGLGDPVIWHGDRRLELVANQGVAVVIGTEIQPAVTCVGGRQEHRSVAMDDCAPFDVNISQLWTDLFSGF